MTRGKTQNRGFSRILHHELELELELVVGGGQTTLSFQLGREPPAFLLLCHLLLLPLKFAFSLLILKCMFGWRRANEFVVRSAPVCVRIDAPVQPT